MRTFLAGFAALLLSVFSLTGANGLSGRRAPGFSLPDLQQKQHDLQDYRGKVVVMDIMLTNCPHCRTFTRVLEEVKAKYGDRLVVLSMVNPPDNGTTVQRYINETKTTIPILFDCGQVAASYLKVTPQNPTINVPHVFLIDGQGMIRKDFGYSIANREIFEGRALFRELDQMLAAKPARAKTT